MTHKVIQTRDKLLARLPVTGEILRGSLVHRITRHSEGCATCARGEGHPLWVLTVAYPGGRTRQLSLRLEQVARVRQWLDNYRKLKQGLETICELNHQLLRADKAASKARRQSRD
jgi:type II secretory pathway component PulF